MASCYSTTVGMMGQSIQESRCQGRILRAEEQYSELLFNVNRTFYALILITTDSLVYVSRNSKRYLVSYVLLILSSIEEEEPQDKSGIEFGNEKIGYASFIII